jgi:hypothetical protein
MNSPYRLPWQDLLSCGILSVPAAAAAAILLNVYNRPSPLLMAAPFITPIDPVVTICTNFPSYLAANFYCHHLSITAPVSLTYKKLKSTA